MILEDDIMQAVDAFKYGDPGFESPYDDVLERSMDPDPDPDAPALDFWKEDWWDRGGQAQRAAQGSDQGLITADQRAEDIHGLTPAPTAAERARDIHGVSSITRHDLLGAMMRRKGSTPDGPGQTKEYQWGGTSAKTGFDCSGIIWRIMRNNGFTNFPRTSGEIYAHSKKISVAKALKTPGAILWHEGHIAISQGNGKTIEAMGEAYGVVEGEGRGRFTGGGILPETPTAGRKNAKKAVNSLKHYRLNRSRGRADYKPVELVSSRTGLSDSSPLAFGLIGAVEDMDREVGGRVGGRGHAVSSPDQLNDIERQVYEGFMAAGREDLAKMVGTTAFDKWIGAESGWDPNNVSPANNQGLANDGLFQVWRGHAFNSNGEFSRYSPRKQARLVAEHFSLTPDDIRNYALAISKGSYEGWG